MESLSPLFLCFYKKISMTNNYLVHYTVELASGQFDLVEWVWVWGWGLGKLRRDCINWDLQ